MNDAAEDDPILGTSTLRGILLLGGVAVVAYIAYTMWKNQKAVEMSLSHTPNIVRVPIALAQTQTKPGIRK